MKLSAVIVLVLCLGMFSVQCSGGSSQQPGQQPAATQGENTEERSADAQPIIANEMAPPVLVERDVQGEVVAEAAPASEEGEATQEEAAPQETEADQEEPREEPQELQEPSVTNTCVAQWFNGGDFQVASNSDLFVVEFPGNNVQSGKLHRISQDGRIQSNINVNLPRGASKIVRSLAGNYYVGGGDWQRTTIMRINADSGETQQTIFDGVPAAYATLLAVDRQQSLFLLSDQVLHRVRGEGPAQRFGADLEFVPQMITETPEEGKFYVADASHLGTYRENGGFRSLSIAENNLVRKIVADGNGNLFVLFVEGDPFDCMFGRSCSSKVVLYRNGEAPAIPLFNQTATLRGIAYDFNRNELVIVSQRETGQGESLCTNEAPVAVTRIGNLGNATGEVNVASADGEVEEGEGEGAQNQCPVCGSGTQLQNNVCVPLPTHRFQCGNGTVAVGDRCLPQIFVDCQAMFDFCMNACDVIEVPRLGWGPCTRACYVSEDYCEDHFRATVR